MDSWNKFVSKYLKEYEIRYPLEYENIVSNALLGRVKSNDVAGGGYGIYIGKQIPVLFSKTLRMYWLSKLFRQIIIFYFIFLSFRILWDIYVP